MNSSNDWVEAASTKGQLPTEHVNLVPVEFRFSSQYAAALYCAKRSRLLRREELTSKSVSLAQANAVLQVVEKINIPLRSGAGAA